jgi:galactokinase
MQDARSPKAFLDNATTEALFATLYGPDKKAIRSHLARYKGIRAKFAKHFPSGDIQWFSAPGRTEIGGNHTDHNAGRVLAASIDLDSVAAVVQTSETRINVVSEGFPSVFSVDINDTSLHPGEKGTTAALIRGIVSRFKELGCTVGAFNAYIASDVTVGSGLSSSASFEVLLGTILNTLYNSGRIIPQTIAMIGQYAENVFFGKPCGCMDQMACAVGGIIAIDFKEAGKPSVKRLHFDFRSQEYRLVVVDTGGNHAGLTSDYAAVPAEMRSVADFFGKKTCREISFTQVVGRVKDLRQTVGDRAILRALHFFEENERVVRQVRALRKGDFSTFLKMITESGDSSYKLLQNCYTTKNPSEQGIPIALAFTRKYLDQIGQGACRVHGGGFAGTIQVFLPEKYVRGYKVLMSAIFSEQSVLELGIRPCGGVHLNSMLTKHQSP